MAGYVRVFAGIGAAIAWGALIFSLVLDLAGPDAVGAVLGRFVSSFTIETNAMAALAFTAVAADPRRTRFTGFIGAVAVYLFIVALVYFAEFHGALETTGLRRIPDAAIHDGVPLLFLVFLGGVLAPKGLLGWRGRRSPVAVVFPLRLSRLHADAGYADRRLFVSVPRRRGTRLCPRGRERARSDGGVSRRRRPVGAGRLRPPSWATRTLLGPARARTGGALQDQDFREMFDLPRTPASNPAPSGQAALCFSGPGLGPGSPSGSAWRPLGP